MKTIITALLLSAAISTSAFAANEGGYVAVDLGQVSYSAGTVSAFSNTTFPKPGAITLGGGYRFSPYVGVEADYSIISNSTINTANAGGFAGLNATETLKTSSLQVAAIGILPLGDKFDLFGKLGVANTKIDYTMSTSGAAVVTTSASASKTNLMFGIGGQFNINKHFGIRLQYQDFGKVTFSGAATGDIGVKIISVGGMYSF